MLSPKNIHYEQQNNTNQRKKTIQKKLRIVKIKGYDIYVDSNEKIFIPESMTMAIIQSAHNFLIHPGVNKCYESLRKFLNIYKLKEKILDFSNRCMQCQKIN